MSLQQVNRGMRWLAACGALLAAASVGLSAYAAHAPQGADQVRLQTAAVFAFGHGVALVALDPGVASRCGRLALATLLVGVLLFSGSLTAGAIAHRPTTLAPVGGTLLMAGWLLLAIDCLRR